MAGLARETDTIIDAMPEASSTDAMGLVFASQKIEHYEIATYGRLHELALTLEMTGVADLPDSILTEEKNADHSLTPIAITHVNSDALEEA